MANSKSVYKDEQQEAAADAFIENINRLLEENNLSVNGLAERTPLDQSNFNKVLNKKLKLQLRDVLICADYFHVSIDQLLSKTDSDFAGEPSTEKNGSPKEHSIDDIVNFVFFLLKTDRAKPIPTSIEEKLVYVYNQEREDEWGSNGFTPEKKVVVEYPALYFPMFYDPKDTADEYEADLAAKDGGNYNEMVRINKMIDRFVKYLPGYKNGEIQDKEFERIVKQMEEE